MMKKDFSNSELIEAFLEGKLSPAESAQFESRLETDPLLKHDFMREQDLVRNLKLYRKNQLKSQLGEVNISLSKIRRYNTLRALGVVAAVSLAGFFTFWSFSSGETASVLQMPKQKNQVVELPDAEPTSLDLVTELQLEVEPKKPVEQSPNPVTEKEIITQPAEQAIVSESARSVTVSNKVIKEEAEPTINIPVANVPEINDQFEDHFEVNLGDQVETQEDFLASEPLANKSITINTLNDSDYSFHYQFSDNSLTLYGDFTEDTYEILELIESERRYVYLYYQGDYFKLEKSSNKILPLHALENQKLINTLHNLQQKKTL